MTLLLAVVIFFAVPGIFLNLFDMVLVIDLVA